MHKKVIQYNQMGQQQHNIANIILELNKCGLSYLKYFQYSKAIEYLKKAEKLIYKELLISTSNHKINSLASVTYNNLACYYKKTKKPKVALNYLKKSLDLQITKINDWISTGSTHLNICAIYSSLNNHQQALCHATLALELLQMQQKDLTQQSKCYWNFKMLCNYNKAIEQQHLKMFDQSVMSYTKAKQLAAFPILNNRQIINICDESIAKISSDKELIKKKYEKSILHKKQQELLLHQKSIKHRYTSIKTLRLNDKSSKQMKKQCKSRNFISVNEKEEIKHPYQERKYKNSYLMKNKTEPSQYYSKIY